jgi:type I restriction enzyme, S subunit
MEANSLAPKLRFRGFEGSFKIQSLGNFINLFSGYAFKGNDISVDSKGIPLLRGINITEGHIRHSKKIDRYFSGNISKMGKLFLKVDDLVIGMDGSKVGKNVALITEKDKDSLLVQRVARIRANHHSDIRFIYQQILSNKFHNYVDIVNTSSGIPHISAKQIKGFKIGFPSLPEQQKTASFLTSVDKKINLLTKKKALLESYKKGVMQKIFSQEIRFKDEDGEDFPDWEGVRLGLFLEHKSKRNKENKIDLVLSVSNKRGFISQKEQFDGHSVASKDVKNYKVVVKGDYAYNPSRINVGSIARLEDFETGIVSPMYVVFKLKNNLNSIFFDELCSSHKFKYLIKIGCSGSVRDSLNFDEMEKFEVILPSIKEQEKIASFINSLDKKIELVDFQLERNKEFKKGLLQQMFV